MQELNDDVVTFFDKKYRAIDLGYDISDQTIFWPGGEGFNLCMFKEGSSDHTHNNFYAAGSFTCAEHGGTHIDAPFHFHEQGDTVDMIKLKNLFGPCRVISTT